MKNRVLAAGAAAATLALTVGAWSAPAPQLRAATVPALSGLPVREAEVPALQSYVVSHPGQFAGLYADRATGTLHIDIAAGSASGAAAGLAREVASQSRALARTPGRAGKRYTLAVRTVRYSQRQLLATMKQITTRQPWGAQVKPVLSSWGPDPVTDTVRVGVTRISSGLLAAARAAFGTRVTLARQPRIHNDGLTVRPRKPVKVVHVTASRLAKLEGSAWTGRKNVAAAAPPTPSRLSDVEPYYGGDRIISIAVSQGVITSFAECTTGFKWTAPAMSTAGHCGPTGTVWYQGYYDSSANTIYLNGNMGTAFSTQFGNGRIDGQLMNGASYYPSVYTSMTGSQEVTGFVPPWVGLDVCTDGSFTGENCSGVVQYVNQCLTIESINSCGQDIAVSSNGSMLSQPGDSGGPVYSYNTPSAGISACGSITAGTTAGNITIFTDIYQMVGAMNDGTIGTP